MVSTARRSLHRFDLPVDPPFAAAEMVDFLARRAIPGVEKVTAEGTYRRGLTLSHGPATVALSLHPTHVEVDVDVAHPDDAPEAVARCRRLLDLDADAERIDGSLRRSPLLAPFVERTPGRRSPGAVDGGEMLVRAVVGQQVSLAASITVIARAITRIVDDTERGSPAVADDAEIRPFPAASVWASLDPATLPMPRSRAEALVASMTLVAEGTIDLGGHGDAEKARAELLAVRGIGPWTVDYVAMRALGDADCFLPTDLAVRRGLAAAGGPTAPAEVRALAETWRPHRSYALHHLWSLA